MLKLKIGILIFIIVLVLPSSTTGTSITSQPSDPTHSNVGASSLVLKYKLTGEDLAYKHAYFDINKISRSVPESKSGFWHSHGAVFDALETTVLDTTWENDVEYSIDLMSFLFKTSVSNLYWDKLDSEWIFEGDGSNPYYKLRVTALFRARVCAPGQTCFTYSNNYVVIDIFMHRSEYNSGGEGIGGLPVPAFDYFIGIITLSTVYYLKKRQVLEY